jgi:hypothetical protein
MLQQVGGDLGFGEPTTMTRESHDGSADQDEPEAISTIYRTVRS